MVMAVDHVTSFEGVAIAGELFGGFHGVEKLVGGRVELGVLLVFGTHRLLLLSVAEKSLLSCSTQSAAGAVNRR